MSCGVVCRRSLDPALLWLWCRLVATAPIRPLAWESPYAIEAALKRQKKKKKKKKTVMSSCLKYPGEILVFQRKQFSFLGARIGIQETSLYNRFTGCEA